jgi:hypothetical protein
MGGEGTGYHDQKTSEIHQLSRYLRMFVVLGGGFSVGNVIVRNTIDGNLLIVLSAFTIQSNFLIWLWCLLALQWMGTPRYDRLTGNLKAALTVYIAVTFLVFFILIEPRYDPEGIRWWSSLFNHYLLPWAFISDFVIAERTRLGWTWPIKSLIYPLLYLVVVLVYGQMSGDYLYYFLNPSEQGVGGVILSVALMAALFLLIGYIFTFVNRSFLTNPE